MRVQRANLALASVANFEFINESLSEEEWAALKKRVYTSVCEVESCLGNVATTPPLPLTRQTLGHAEVNQLKLHSYVRTSISKCDG